MPGHALRGLATAGLALVVLETFARTSNGNVGGLFASFGTVAQRLMSPSVPLIPDRRAGGSGSDPSQQGYITPAQAAAGAKVAANLPGIDAITGPGSLTGNPSFGQYVTGGGLSPGIAGNPALQPGYVYPTTPRPAPYGRAPR